MAVYPGKWDCIETPKVPEILDGALAYVRAKDGFHTRLGGRALQVPTSHCCAHASTQAEVPATREGQEDKKCSPDESR